MQSHPSSATKEGADAPISQKKKSKRSIDSADYSDAVIDKMRNNLYILLENYTFQQKQIEKQFVLMNPTRIELGDHRKLLHNLDVSLIQMQYTFTESFGYLNMARYNFKSLADIRLG